MYSFMFPFSAAGGSHSRVVQNPVYNQQLKVVEMADSEDPSSGKNTILKVTDQQKLYEICEPFFLPIFTF